MTVSSKCPRPLARETVEHVVSAACLAPSVHNTQPWRFVAHDNVLDVYADRSKQLAVLDPVGRQLHLSCGAAIQHARVAARALGLDPHVQLLPEPGNPDHLATLELLPGGSASPRELAQAGALLERYTYRGAFEPQPVEPSILESLRLAVDQEGAALRLVTEQDDRVALAVLLSRADELELEDPGYAEELDRWTGRPPEVTEGVPLLAAEGAVATRSSMLTRAFARSLPPAGTKDAPAPVEHPAVVVLVTEQDGPQDWLMAGQALGALLLTAASYAVLAQPLGQVTDIEASRQQLRGALGLHGTPQLALRLGHARTGRRVARRRPTREVLSFPSAPAR